MRLIDADATFDLLRSLGSRDYRREKGTIMDAMKMISHPEYTPTVDAVPVVRCKDCKYRSYDYDCVGNHLCEKRGNRYYCEDNDFCSYGERRADNER